MTSFEEKLVKPLLYASAAIIAGFIVHNLENIKLINFSKVLMPIEKALFLPN